MYKILVGWVFTCVVITSAPLALGANIATQALPNVSLEKVKLSSQQVNATAHHSLNSQSNPINNEATVKPIKKTSDAESTSTKAQLGLLLTALFCFVALSNRRGI